MANMVVCLECSKRLTRLLVALSRGRGTDKPFNTVSYDRCARCKTRMWRGVQGQWSHATDNEISEACEARGSSYLVETVTQELTE